MQINKLQFVMFTMSVVLLLGAFPVAAQVLDGNNEPDPTFNNNAMQLWYRADSGVDNPGGLVGQWNDRSTFGRHAIQTDPNHQPTHSTAGLGGRQVVNFDDSNVSGGFGGDFLNTGFDATNIFNDSFTLFSVVAPTEGRAEGNIWFGVFTANVNRAFANIDGNFMSFVYQEDTQSAVNNNPANPFPATPTEYGIFTWEVDASGNEHRTYFDDGGGGGYRLQDTKNVAALDHSSWANTGSPYLGAGNHTDSGNQPFLPLGGGIVELILYKGVLDPADRLTVQQYLGAAPRLEATWVQNSAGIWTVPLNWNNSVVPSSQDDAAVFGDAISSPATVVVDTDQTVNAITFDHTVTYVIGGAASINLQQTTGELPRPPAITVAQGNHEFQAVTNLRNDTTVDVADGSTLVFNNALNLLFNTLTKTGPGEMSIRNDLVLGGGTIVLNEGTVTGNGSVGGDLHNDGGTVSPGNSPGVMTVPGDFSQSASGTLLIEIAGTDAGTEHDVLVVDGEAILDGTLEVSLLDGFEPESGDRFDILDLGEVTGGFRNVVLPALSGSLAWDQSALLADGSISVVPEPATWIVAGIGLIGCVVRLRRRRTNLR